MKAFFGSEGGSAASEGGNGASERGSGESDIFHGESFSMIVHVLPQCYPFKINDGLLRLRKWIGA